MQFLRLLKLFMWLTYFCLSLLVRKTIYNIIKNEFTCFLTVQVHMKTSTPKQYEMISVTKPARTKPHLRSVIFSHSPLGRGAVSVR